MSTGLELILFIGLQASGKSTYYKQAFYRTHIRLNMDMLKTRYREGILFQACLAGKARIVIDNTNLTREQRAAYIAPAKSAKYSVYGYFFDSSVERCLHYNAMRSEEESVPEMAVISSSRRMERPAYDEGFDLMYFVRKDGEGGFIKEVWIS